VVSVGWFEAQIRCKGISHFFINETCNAQKLIAVLELSSGVIDGIYIIRVHHAGMDVPELVG
jgi:hypothetical protein